MFLLLSHLLEVSSGGGQESGVTHTPKDVHEDREDKQSNKPKTQIQIIAFLGITDIKWMICELFLEKQGVSDRDPILLGQNSH